VAVADQAESLLLLDSPAMAAGKEEGAGVGALFLHIGGPPVPPTSDVYLSLSSTLSPPLRPLLLSMGLYMCPCACVCVLGESACARMRGRESQREGGKRERRETEH
jgi:hypothetical protein